jgi:nucleoid-associated protein YgaU
MAYDYDDGEHYDARILWGRIAVYGVAFLLVFLAGIWWGGRGGDDGEQIVELQAQVDTLQDENRELQDTIDALSAREDEPEPPPPDDEDNEAEADEPVEEEPDAGEETAQADEPAGPAEPQTRTYVVESGDTLRAIARDVYGDPDMYDLIAEANGLTRETVLTVGQELVIPPAGDG